MCVFTAADILVSLYFFFSSFSLLFILSAQHTQRSNKRNQIPLKMAAILFSWVKFIYFWVACFEFYANICMKYFNVVSRNWFFCVYVVWRTQIFYTHFCWKWTIEKKTNNIFSDFNWWHFVRNTKGNAQTFLIFHSFFWSLPLMGKSIDAQKLFKRSTNDFGGERESSCDFFFFQFLFVEYFTQSNSLFRSVTFFFFRFIFVVCDLKHNTLSNRFHGKEEGARCSHL